MNTNDLPVFSKQKLLKYLYAVIVTSMRSFQQEKCLWKEEPILFMYWLQH